MQHYQVQGALAANHIFYSKAPFGYTIVHVSLCNTSANAGTLKLGDGSDDDGYLAAEDFGVSGTPTEVATRAGFDGAVAAGQYPHIDDGDILKVTITDHASHMTDASVVITCMPD